LPRAVPGGSPCLHQLLAFCVADVLRYANQAKQFTCRRSLSSLRRLLLLLMANEDDGDKKMMKP